MLCSNAGLSSLACLIATISLNTPVVTPEGKVHPHPQLHPRSEEEGETSLPSPLASLPRTLYCLSSPLSLLPAAPGTGPRGQNCLGLPLLLLQVQEVSSDAWLSSVGILCGPGGKERYRQNTENLAVTQGTPEPGADHGKSQAVVLRARRKGAGVLGTQKRHLTLGRGWSNEARRGL